MSAVKTIIVGTDGSRTSMLAVGRAAELSVALDAQLVIGVAHQVSAKMPLEFDLAESADLVLSPDGSLTVAAIFAVARERAEEAGATKIVERVADGQPDTALHQLANDVDAQLLVVGSRGMNSLRGRLMGSVTSAVLRHAPCDVYVVHTAS